MRFPSGAHGRTRRIPNGYIEGAALSERRRPRDHARAPSARTWRRMMHPLEWALQELDWAAADKRTVLGFRIGVLAIGRFQVAENRALAFSKVEAGIALIKTWEPARYHRIQHLLRGILVRPYPCPTYRVSSNICVLPDLSVLDRSPGVIAGDIVHEAVHARFARAGLIAFAGDESSRMEERCILEDMAFAQRVPDSVYLRKQHYIDFLTTELTAVRAARSAGSGPSA